MRHTLRACSRDISLTQIWSTSRGRNTLPNYSAAKKPTKPRRPPSSKRPKLLRPAAAKPAAAAVLSEDTEPKAIYGPAKKIVENMEESLSVPTATSFRSIPVKVLEENRRIINEHLAAKGRGKVSFTHIIAWAIIKSVKAYPSLNFGYGVVNGVPSRLEHENINLGIAIDVEKKDGSRSLLVPNIKGGNRMNFAQFFASYNELVKKAREGKLEIADFKDTTISLTNPGTIGTIASNPRLMAGQSAIIATGAIEYPAEYQAMTSATLSQIGISKIMTLTSTYDHRVIQGAESGLFLAKIHEFLIGQHGFYDEIFDDLEINYPPMRWAEDYNPSLFGGDRMSEQTEKQANVLQLVNAYRIRGHLLADIDPLNMTTHHAAELDLENFGLTIWDLDREFITGGLHGEKTATFAGSSISSERRIAARSAASTGISRAARRKSGSGHVSVQHLSTPSRSIRSYARTCCKS